MTILKWFKKFTPKKVLRLLPAAVLGFSLVAGSATSSTLSQPSDNLKEFSQPTKRLVLQPAQAMTSDANAATNLGHGSHTSHSSHSSHSSHGSGW